jgi:hypothetical protein
MALFLLNDDPRLFDAATPRAAAAISQGLARGIPSQGKWRRSMTQ